MALSSANQYDIRTTGSDTNGGGFHRGATGTDWSTQDSPQYSVTDGVTAGSTTITSATANFGTDVVGNVMYVQGGTGSVVAGWYEITARASNTSITVDRATGLTAGTGVTLHIGGGFQTLGAAFALAVDNNTFWVKTGTYTLTAGISTPAFVGWSLRGYGSTHGDNGTKPLITTATNSVALLSAYANSNGEMVVLDNLSLSNTASTRAAGFLTGGNVCANLIVNNCIFDGFTNGIDGITNNQINHGFIINTEIKNCTTAGINNSGGATGSIRTFACYIHNNGIGILANCSLLANSTIFAANTTGLSLNNSSGVIASLEGCAIANNTGDGVLINGGPTVMALNLYSNIIYGNGGWGVNCSSNPVAQWNTSGGYNAYGANTSGNYRNAVGALTGDVALSASPFTSSTNFALNSTAGGGAACKQAGFPGAFSPAALTTGFADIGPAQASAAGGGGGGLLVPAGMGGGMRG